MDSKIRELVRAPSCLMCNTELKYLFDEQDRADNIRDGGDVVLTFHYGSRHDTMEYFAHICDDCATVLIKNKRVKLERDYMQVMALGYRNVNAPWDKLLEKETE